MFLHRYGARGPVSPNTPEKWNTNSNLLLHKKEWTSGLFYPEQQYSIFLVVLLFGWFLFVYFWLVDFCWFVLFWFVVCFFFFGLVFLRVLTNC